MTWKAPADDPGMEGPVAVDWWSQAYWRRRVLYTQLEEAGSIVVGTEQRIVDSQAGEQAAMASLRAQIARLERELSGLVAAGFPHVAGVEPRAGGAAGPHLPDLGELEQTRDRLVARVHAAQQRTASRVEFERRSRALLERMKLEPGRYRFTRVRATDVGESGCGVWQVRPRLGIVGMLAGWWELTLSSGCP
jgi:hypothetical protein